jgi:hypothetical protein
MSRALASMFRATIVAAALLAAACGTARYIGQAQTAFNDGASAEIEARATPGADALSNQRAEASYATARALLGEEIRANADALRADELLGVAYTLKALAEWRLSDLRDDEDLRVAAQKSADAAKGVATGTRDRVVLAALPGLLDHERGLRDTDYDRAHAHFDSACRTLDASLAGVPANHAVRVWVRLSQMQTCQAWHVAMDRATNDERRRDRPLLTAAWRAAARDLKAFAAADPRLDADIQERARLVKIPPEKVYADPADDSGFVPHLWEMHGFATAAAR